MSNTWKRLLSLALALCMVLSLGVTALADDGENGTISIVPEDQAEPAPAPAAEEGTALESYELDPSTLPIPRLGLEEEDVGTIRHADEPEEEETVDLDELVRVSIFLDEPCALEAGYTVETARAAGSYRNGLRARQDAMTAQIEGVIGHGLNVHWNMTLALNAISADLTVGEMEKVAAIPGVKAVERENRYLPAEASAEPNTGSTSLNMVGAQAAWYIDGYTGAGSRIAIIDTGIDTTHQSFNADAFDHAIAEVRADGKTVDLMTSIPGGLNGAGVRVNSKIPYGYNYVDGDTRIDHKDSEGNHGSHVAGIAAANRYIKSGSNYLDAVDEVDAVGMAPDAQLLIMKVFGSGGGAYDSDYMVAIEDAILLEADVVNLSLGSAAPGFTFSNGYQDILNNLTNGEHNAKMVVSISAGNSYDAASFLENRYLYAEDVNMHTGGSPGSFVNSLCVAAAQNTRTKGMPLIFNGSQKVFYSESTEDSEGNTYTNPEMNTIVGTYDYVYIDALGTPADFAAVNGAVSLSGKIVIVNRGDLSFSEKGNNAKSYNPKGMVVANNISGSILMNLADYTGTFPMVSISLKDANTIKANATSSGTAGGVTYYTGTVQVTNVEEEFIDQRENAEITDFSSWGVPGSLIMKPEITAPGGDIYSVYGTSNADSGSSSTTYESFSGTSMAAPHITGLVGVLAQYLRENPVSNSALAKDYNTRAIAQSLLMSTATAMKPGDAYLPILQQGAGLADVHLAVNAKSVVMMGTGDDTLTAKTGSAADGKVKAEFGDDPEREGVYRYSFTLYNLTDEAQVYTLKTELFTQALLEDEEGMLYMSRGTTGLNASASYAWLPSGAVAQGHDVDKDGDTDQGDAQAILNYITGMYDEVEDLDAVLDLAAADLDGDEAVTSQDAYLLLGWEEESPLSGYVLPAGSTALVTVTITLSEDEKEYLDEYYPGGAYIEGFTCVSTGTATREGESLETVHSIPLLGFYGSWTDAGMFDTTSYAQNLYETTNEQPVQLPYSGKTSTNYLRIQQNGANVIFTGNPYMVEEEFPVDRLAINSNTKMVNIAYNLIRSAGTTGYAVSKVTADGAVTDVLSASVYASEVTGLFYHVNAGSWQNTTTKLYSVNKSPADYGLQAGDLFRVGFYAIPEYYAMVHKSSYNAANSGLLNAAKFQELLESDILGKGAFVGYDFVVDDERPQLVSYSLNGSQLSVTATDNEALAYVAVLSLDGTEIYAEKAPGENSCTITLDASDAIANAQGYVAVFVGDYAGNEIARAVKVNDNAHVEKTVYVLTNTLTAGDEYLILNTATPGVGYSLYYTLNTSGSTATTGANAVNVNAGTADTGNKPYIESGDAATTAVWTAGSGSTSGTWTFNNNGWYLRRSGTSALTITKDTSRRDWTWNGSSNQLVINSRYLRYYNNTFSLASSADSVYLYVKTTISYEVDPDLVSGVTVTPASAEIYRGDTVDLTAKVIPLTAEDRSVTWSSSNTSVATVDQFGHVTGISAGTATITATSNADSTKVGSCAVTVVAINKELSAVVWDEEGDVFFSYFNANNLPTWTKRSNNAVSAYLTSAMMASTSDLYAATNDLSTSYIYTVNRSTYALTELGENYVVPFGMATVGTSFGGTSYFVYAFAGYIIFGNLQPETDDDYGTYCGFPYGLLDLSETDVGDAYAVAICCRNKSTTSAGYYFLDETGKIWQTNQTYSQTNGISFSAPTLVYDTEISAGLQYNSIYYDGTNLYWTRQDGEYAELIILANANTAASRKLYRAGNFGENVWPVAGLYVNGSLAPASVGDETEDIDLITLDLKPLATREELMTQEVLDRFAAAGYNISVEEDEAPGIRPVDEPIIEPVDPIEIPIDDPIIEPVEDTAAIEPVYGSLHAIVGRALTAGSRIPGELTGVIGGDFGEDEPGLITIPIMESEASHNGLVALTYDAELLGYVGFVSGGDATILSVNPDTDKGVITIAYARYVDGTEADYIPAETPIVNLIFTVGCEKAICDLTTLERNGELDLNESEELIIQADHIWGDPEWDWAEDFSSATAIFTCQKDPRHIECIPAEIESGIVNGYMTYTASVELEGKTYTDIRQGARYVTVSFDAGLGAVEPEFVQIPAGSALGTLPTPTRDDGWKFIAWYTETEGGDEVTAESTFDNDAVIYAHWRLPGDVDGNGKVELADVILLARYVKANGEGVTIAKDSGDIDGNGAVELADVILLARYVKAGCTGYEIN